jgi:GTP-binding protein YchF
MGLKCGIIGITNVGKTVIFNCISKTKAETSNFAFSTSKSNIGVIDVPDERLEKINSLIKSARIVPATFEIVDIPGLAKGASQGEGIGNKFLADIQQTDAIIHVLRCFDDPELPHIEGSIDPVRDMEIVDLELQVRDLDLVQRKIQRLEKMAKSGDKEPKRQAGILEKLVEHIENFQNVRDFELPELPIHIECFDNSNIQGDYPVAAMVCFKNAKPSKADYRHFNINTVAGPNDYASMEEVILRRYKRIVEEQQTLPQLIIIDGGKGQLSSAVGILEKIGLRGKISIIAIAEKLEELYFPNDPVPLHIDKKSETLRLIQYMRDEAHHFGITHYRKKHEKGVIKSTLTEIDGIGEGYAKKLLYKFKSVKRIGEASLEELQQAIGKVKGKQVYDFFQKKN